MNSIQLLPRKQKSNQHFNSFDEVNTTLLPKQDTDSTKRKKEQLALWNTDTKILDKILGDRIQQYIKKIIL